MTEAVRGQRQRQTVDHYVVAEMPVLYRVALSLTGQPADAEDLVQETLIRTLRAVDLGNLSDGLAGFVCGFIAETQGSTANESNVERDRHRR